MLYPKKNNIFWFSPILSVLLCLVLLLSPAVLLAQKKNKKKDAETEQPLELDEDALLGENTPNLRYELSEEEAKLAEEEKKQTKNKKTKKKKKVYFGIKTKSGFTKNGTSSITIEAFRIIEDSYLLKDPYQKEIYYYDVKAKRLKTDNYDDFKAKIKKGLKAYLLHGKYEKYINREPREEGYFYKGLKHDKWITLDSKGILIEKIIYDLGYPSDTEFTYYDAAQRKIKEIIPIVHGTKQGTYYRFYENGVTAEMGEYQNDCKVKIWREWHENRARKADTNYPVRWWDEKAPELLRQWTDKGVMTYDIDRGGKL